MSGAAGSTVLSIVIQARDEASKVMQSFKGTMLQASVAIAQAGFAMAANYTKIADGIVNAINRMRGAMLQWVSSGGAGNFGASIGRDLALIGRSFAALPGLIGLAGRAFTFTVTGMNQGIELLMKGVGLLKSVWEHTFGGVVETAGSLVAVSRQLGITVEQVQDLQQVARETGANFEALQQIFTRTSRALVQANDENSRAGTILFQGLKLTREEFEKLKAASPLQQMVQLTEAFLKFGQNAQRNADMTAIFGQQWRQTIVMMAGGASTLKEAVDRLNEQGRVTDELAQKANALQSAWAGVEGVFSGFNIKLFGDPELFQLMIFALGEIRRNLLLVSDALVTAFKPQVRDLIIRASEAVKQFTDYLATKEGTEAFKQRIGDVITHLGKLKTAIEGVINYWNTIDKTSGVYAILGIALGFYIPAIGPRAGLAIGIAADVASKSFWEHYVKGWFEGAEDFVKKQEEFWKADAERRRLREKGIIADVKPISEAADVATPEPKTDRPGLMKRMEIAAATKAVSDAIKEAGDAAERATTPYVNLGKAIKSVDGAYTEILKLLHNVDDEIKAGTITTENYELALTKLKPAVDAIRELAREDPAKYGANPAAQAAIKTAQEWIVWYDDYIAGQKLEVKHAEDVAEAHKKVTDSLKDSAEAAENAKTAVGKYRQEILDAAKSGHDWAKTTEEDRKALIEAAAKASGAEAWRDAQEAIKDMWAEYGRGKITLEEAISKTEQLQKLIDKMKAAAELGDPLAANQAQWAAAEAARITAAADAADKAKKLLKDEEKAYFDLFGSITEGFQKVVDGLVAGTLDMKGVFQSLKTSIIGSFTEAFAEGLKSKLGFDKSFKLNIVGLGKEAVGLFGNLFGGVFGGGGTQGAGGGLFSSLLSGVEKYTGGFFGLKAGGGGAIAGSTPGQPIMGGASGYLGLGGTAGLLLGAGTYAGLSGQNNYAGMLSGAAGLGYGAQAAAGLYGPQISSYLGQHAPQLLKLGGLFGVPQPTPPATVPFTPVGGGPATGATPSMAPQVAGTFGNIAAVIGVVTGLASAAMGIYGAIKADTAHGKAAAAASAGAGIAGATAGAAILAGAATSSVVPVVGWIVAAVLAIVAGVLYATQPGPNYNKMLRAAAESALEDTFGKPGAFKAGGTHELRGKAAAAYEGLDEGQRTLLEAGGRGVAKRLREEFPSVGYENAIKWVQGITTEGIATLMASGKNFDALMKKLFQEWMDLGGALVSVMQSTFKKGLSEFREGKSVETYAAAVKKLMDYYEEEFPKAIDKTRVAVETVGEFGIATVARLKREALQDVATEAITRGTASEGPITPGFLRSKRKLQVLRRQKGRRKRQAAAEQAETAVDEFIAGIERTQLALKEAGAGAPLRSALADFETARGGIEALGAAGAKVFAEQYPKAIDAAIQAVQAWGTAMGQMIDQLRAMRKQMLDDIRAYWAEQDSLRGAANIVTAKQQGEDLYATYKPPDFSGMESAEITAAAKKFVDELYAKAVTGGPVEGEQTAARYGQWIADAEQVWADVVSAGDSLTAQITAVQDIMSLLREAAQAQISDIREAADRDIAKLQGYADALSEQADAEGELIEKNNDRIEALDKEIGILNTQISAVSALANMVDAIKDAIGGTKLAGASRGVGQIVELQRQTVEAMADFHKAQSDFTKAYDKYEKATDANRNKLALDLQQAGQERATAAQKALGLSQNLLQAASGVFAVGTGEYLSIQSQVLAYQRQLLKAANDAKAAQKALEERAAEKQDARDQLQKDNEEHQKNIEGYSKTIKEIQEKIRDRQDLAAKAIAEVNKKLAADLAKWFPVMHKAQLEVMNQMRAELKAQGLSDDEINRALNDPAFASLLIQEQQLEKLDDIHKCTIDVVNAVLGVNPDNPEKKKSKKGKGYAMGGEFIATGPTPIIVGEGFRPEHVKITPLDSTASANGGSGITFNVTFNVNGGGTGSGDGSRFARSAADALEAEMRVRLPRIMEKKIA